MPPKKIADWQLPPGVSRATNDYVHSEQIATQYDEFHATHGLLQFDQQLVNARLKSAAQQLKRPLHVIDLGCGTGRSLRHAIEQGHYTIGVDLSESMLKCAKKKYASHQSSQPRRDQWIQANMVELDFQADAAIDMAICLYSSLGMVKGRSHRLKTLRHVRRILKSDGRFILHVHNRRNWWTTAQGRTLIWRDLWQSNFNRSNHESGDRIYPYRNLPAMFLHIFSRREICQDLRDAGLAIDRFHYLDQASTGFLTKAWFCPQLRSAGFLIEVIVRHHA